MKPSWSAPASGCFVHPSPAVGGERGPCQAPRGCSRTQRAFSSSVSAGRLYVSSYSSLACQTCWPVIAGGSLSWSLVFLSVVMSPFLFEFSLFFFLVSLAKSFTNFVYLFKGPVCVSIDLSHCLFCLYISLIFAIISVVSFLLLTLVFVLFPAP